jgi:hypothetical protein
MMAPDSSSPEELSGNFICADKLRFYEISIQLLNSGCDVNALA